MVSLIKLKSKNIDSFRFLCDKKFKTETYDKNFFDIYQNIALIPKILIKKTVKLIECNKKIIGYIWIDIFSNQNARILSFYIDENYLDCISNSLLSDYNNLSLRYETINLDNINNSLSILGFNIIKSSILMELNSIYYDKELEVLSIKNSLYNNYNLYKDANISFKNFTKTYSDIELRCNLQNSIFESDERIPITIDDIANDINQDYFIDDLAIFMIVNGICIGYGQIIFSYNKYTIVNLGILSEFRGFGFSKILLNELIKLAKNKSISPLYLRVDSYNYPALSLYKWAGFKYNLNINTWER